MSGPILEQNPTQPLPPKKASTEPKLSSIMATNLALLIIVGVTSAIILMFGDFEGKVIRTVTTLLLFGAFTRFAALDSTREAPPRYMLISQIGHMYMLGLSLMLIWGSLLGQRGYFDDFSILTKTILIVLLVKLGILAIQKVSDFVYTPLSQVSLAGQFCAGFLSLTAVMFTLPIGTDYFLKYADLYWKVAVIVMIFAALTIAMIILLSLYFRDSIASIRRHEESEWKGSRPDEEYATMDKAPKYGDREPVRREQPFKIESLESNRDENVTDFFENRPVSQQKPEPVAAEAPPVPAAPASPPSYAVRPQQAPQPAPQIAAKPGTPSYAPPVAGSQPWPVFPNGLPLPAAQNGRPDYAVLQYVASVHAESERQWFGA